MDKFIIKGGRRLKGTIRVSGSKNAALPMMAAALLTNDPVTLHNVPDLRDIETMANLLASMGVEIARHGSSMTLHVTDESSHVASYELVSTMRASFCVLGPVLAKRRKAKVSLPGGCVIGPRPVDLHIKGVRALGATVAIDGGYVIADAPRLKGCRLYLGGAFGSTVTGTANILMAAVLADGLTIIENAACEPEVQELALLLKTMGARIDGIGSPKLTVTGVRELHGAEVTVIPDRIEAGTFMAAAVITGGEVDVLNVVPDHVTATIEALREIGASVECAADRCLVRAGPSIRSIDVTALPYPGFPTDMQAQIMTLLCLAGGLSIVTDKIYPDRFMHVAELSRMGAEIRKEGNCAIVHGVRELHGAPVMASDLRASAALILAGMTARGETEVMRIYHIDRGYEKIEERLNAIGASIERTIDKKVVVMPS